MAEPSANTTRLTFLVTGGAGFLGINLIRYLLERGHRVVSLDLAPFDYPDVRERVQIVTGDVRDPDLVERTMRDVDVVVHCAAALPLYSRDEIFSTNVGGTHIVLQSALDAGVQRVIYISSTAVYGIPDHHPLLEDDPLKGVGSYGETKVIAEGICQEYRGKGLCIPILRPKTFVGPERLGVFALLYEWAKDGKNFPMLGSGNNRYQLLDVEDLCQAILLAATGERQAVDQVFNIGAREFTTMREDYQAVLDAAGFGKRIVPIPAGPAVVALRVLEKLHLSPLYQWVYETADKDSYVSIERAERILGYNPRYSNKDALVRNFRWYMEHLDKFQGASGVSHRVPWQQGALRLAKLFF